MDSRGRFLARHFRDAAQRDSVAPPIQDRIGLCVLYDPGSAAHHSASPIASKTRFCFAAPGKRQKPRRYIRLLNAARPG
jgi:hypothetical protein